MKKAVICTKHKKGALIASRLERIGLDVVEDTSFDTDSLGTFDMEVARTLAPIDAARHKAKVAATANNTQFGIGSEGTFGQGPYVGIVNWCEEVLCLYDAQSDHAIYAFAQGPISVNTVDINNTAQLMEIAQSSLGQRWMITLPSGVEKGLSLYDIQHLIEHAQVSFPFTLMPDYRACYCVERQDIIKQAADDLIKRFNAKCPACDKPNFVVNETVQGLPCEYCGFPTHQVKRRITTCEWCQYQRDEPVPTLASQQYCQLCNP